MRNLTKMVSVLLSVVILMSVALCAPFTVIATEQEETENTAVEKTTLDSLEIYKAQCFLGTAYDENSGEVSRCNTIYKYYIGDDLYSPSKEFLDLCYSDDKLMMNYNEWKLYSLAASPSSALDKVAKREDYYESLIISMYSKSTAENDEFKKFINNKIIKNTNKFIGTLCDIAKVSNISELVDNLDVNSPKYIAMIKESVEKNYAPAIVGKFSGKLGDIISASNTIYDLSQRISVYGTMAELDDSTKLWINQMYQSCSANETDTALTAALMKLSYASTDYSGAVLADVISTTFSLSKWAVKKVIDEGIKTLIGSNPVVMAVFSGLKAGKTICNLFFNTDDVCEQLYLMECIYEVESLARKVIDSCSNTFLNSQSLSNAQSFLYSVDCYFEAIVGLDIDCMEKFLDKLYNGGIIKGNKDDYNEHISALENLRSIREKNYNDMLLYFKAAVEANFPNDYEDYFVDVSSKFTYKITNSYVTITGLRSGYKPTILNIPYEIDNYSVTSIGDKAFYGCTSLTSITIPNSIKSIGYCAFFDCTSLENITVDENNKEYSSLEGNLYNKNKSELIQYAVGKTAISFSIPDSVISISERAFSCASLVSITIPDSVKSIGDSVFYNCTNLKSITIPDSVISIGDWAFDDCTSLASITIPDSVTSIGFNAFESCRSLTNVNINSIEAWCKIEFEFKKGGTITSESNPFCYAKNLFLNNKLVTDLVIPDTVTDLKEQVFFNCQSITSVTISNSVKSIGECAFYNCSSLKSATIGDSVTSIAWGAFENCTNLNSIMIPNSVTSIGGSAFFGCTRLASITIPNSVTSIEQYAFWGCESLASITIPNRVTSIRAEAFKNCSSLDSITIPNNVTSIAWGAFENCTSLKDVYYSGSESQWNSIEIKDYNECLTNAKIHFSTQYIESEGIIVTEEKNGGFSSDTRLKVENLEITNEKIIYDISLMQGETPVQSTASVTVKIPVPDTMDSANCKVYRKDADGTYTDMNAVYSNGYMAFTTDHFSIYVLTTGNPNGILGDVNFDGDVNVRDATAIQKHLVNIISLEENQLKLADTNGDGDINIRDATQIQKYLVGLVPSLG